jgi:branched-chain amino acid transport system permease protein
LQLIARWAINSSPGHVWQAIRENERRVEVIGLQPLWFKLLVFVLASFLATVGGVIWLIVLGTGASPQITTATFTLTFLVMVVIGGARNALTARCSRGFLYTRRSAVGSARAPRPSMIYRPCCRPRSPNLFHSRDALHPAGLLRTGWAGEPRTPGTGGCDA